MSDFSDYSQVCGLCSKQSNSRVHHGCQMRLDKVLADLPIVYRGLEAVLYPGRRGGDGRTATRTAPIPPNEEVLNLRGPGGMVGILTDWEDCTRELLEWEPRPFRGNIEQTVMGCVDFLRANLGWLCEEHPDIRGFAADLRRVWTAGRALIDGERAPRRVPVLCPCGVILKVTIDTPGARCMGCGTQYSHSEVLQLPLAERRSAA